VDSRAQAAAPPEPIRSRGSLLFLARRTCALAALGVGLSPVAQATAFALYLLRTFAITGFCHRYFAHRTFRAGRVVQFLMTLAAATAVQRGPLSWAAPHRGHHRYSDEEWHSRSPRRRGFDRRFLLDPILPAAGTGGLMAWLQRLLHRPGASTAQAFVRGLVVSTVVVDHATHTIDSLSHPFGSRRYDTGDDSRNNALLALLTPGEGWHNHRPHYGRKALAALRLMSRLNPVPEKVLLRGRLS
jgi:stearoyl-CoA desaturase (delta-9 desaturase)